MFEPNTLAGSTISLEETKVFRTCKRIICVLEIKRLGD
jgi:hypothetical protein